MPGLTLTLREPPRHRVDVSRLRPDALAGMSGEAVGAITLWVGNRKLRTDEMFEITGDPLPEKGAGVLTIAKGCRRLDGVGMGMASGTLTVQGDCGAYAGAGLAGGVVRITGNAGPFAARSMSEGELYIDGDAGDYLGAAVPGERLGMTGGVVAVAGNVGDRVGDHLRRGTILIGGDAGDYCGARMIAGSIVVLGAAGDFTGFAMKRGTVILFHEPGHVLGTFNDCGRHNLPFLSIFLASIRRFGDAFAALDPSHSRVRRFAGDRGVGGQGEILVYES